MNCSVVIPVYNGEATLLPLIQRLSKVLTTVADSYEVVLVNDGSRDRSWETITQLSREFPWVVGIDLMRNYGQHNTVLCGIRAARYEVIVTMDDDLQQSPEEIPILLNKLAEGYDVVYGVPRKRQHSWWRSMFAALTKRAVAYVMGTKTVRDIGAFRAFRTHLRQAFEQFHGPDVLVDVLLSWGTNRFASVQVEEAPRTIGKSNYNFFKLVRVSLIVLTSFTTAPLRFASFLGFGLTFVGVIGFIYVLVTYFTAGSIPGFPFLASTILLFSGAQLFALGIMGEYLARVFERTGGRPPYSIARTTSEIPQGTSRRV